MGDNPPSVIDILKMKYHFLRIPVGTQGLDEIKRLVDGDRVIAVGKQGKEPACNQKWPVFVTVRLLYKNSERLEIFFVS